MTENDRALRASRYELFRRLDDPTTIVTFFDRVADDVRWTVHGTHPLAGTYSAKADFLAATFGRLGRLMRGGVKLQLQRLTVAGDVAVAELQADSITLEGARYDNRLCWVCRFADGTDDAEIVEVDAYLDSAMVSWTLERNETRGEGAEA